MFYCIELPNITCELIKKELTGRQTEYRVILRNKTWKTKQLVATVLNQPDVGEMLHYCLAAAAWERSHPATEQGGQGWSRGAELPAEPPGYFWVGGSPRCSSWPGVMLFCSFCFKQVSVPPEQACPWALGRGRKRTALRRLPGVGTGKHPWGVGSQGQSTLRDSACSW